MTATEQQTHGTPAEKKSDHAASPVSLAIIQKHLGQKYGLSEEDNEKMVKALVENLEQIFTNAERALTMADQASLARAAHSLKGILLSAGADDLAKLARTMELEIKAGGAMGKSKMQLAELKKRLAPLFGEDG